MRQNLGDPPLLLVFALGAMSFAIAALGFLIAGAILLFTMFGADYFPERWLYATCSGMLPALVATPAFLLGLRQHDLENARASLRAFSAALLCIPLLMIGVAYLAGRLPL